MSHARTQIRTAAVAAVTAIKVGGNAVFAGVYGYRTAKHKNLPDVIIYTVNDEVNHELDTLDGKETHALTVMAEIRAKVTDDLDDTLDGYCVLVEKALKTNVALNALLKQLSLIGTSIEMESETDKENGLATIEYEAWYRVAENDPETIVG